MLSRFLKKLVRDLVNSWHENIFQLIDMTEGIYTSQVCNIKFVYAIESCALYKAAYRTCEKDASEIHR